MTDSGPSHSPFRALANYKELPPIVGWHIMVVALIARSPYAMLPLGLLTAFTASTGDIAIGGMTTAIYSIAMAICSPLIGRASDVWGQKLILLTLIPINALGILGLYWAASTGTQGILLWLLCLLTGATVVPVGSFTRARWVSATSMPRQIAAAFSYESMADELVFVLGPALVGIAASMSIPSAPLLLAFILALAAGMPFALTAPKAAIQEQGTTSEVAAAPRPKIFKVLWAVLPGIVALVGVGMFFGSIQAATTSRAELAGVASQAGLIYAVMGIGSAFAALMVVVLPASFKMSARLMTFGLGMTATTVFIAVTSGLGLTTILLGVAGLFVGPTLVTAFSISEKLAPKGGISVAMTLMQSSVTIGISLGAAVGGAIAEASGNAPTYMFAASAGILIALVGVALSLPYYRRTHKDI